MHPSFIAELFFSYLFSPWLRSISSSPSIPNFSFVTFYTFSSRMSKVSFCSPSIPLIRISILRNDLTIPSIYSLHSQYLTHHLVIFVISVFIWFESDFMFVISSSTSSCLNSRLVNELKNFLEILLNLGLAVSQWDFKISLYFFSCSFHFLGKNIVRRCFQS